MKNRYAALLEFATVSYSQPPIQCGEYEVVDCFNVTHRFNFRRIPRARHYTGRHGLFYHDPDAHWVLVGYVEDGQFNRVPEVPASITRRFDLFLLSLVPKGPNVKFPIVKLTIHRCSWCGKEMKPSESSRFTHDKVCCDRDKVFQEMLDAP